MIFVLTVAPQRRRSKAPSGDRFSARRPAGTHTRRPRTYATGGRATRVNSTSDLVVPIARPPWTMDPGLGEPLVARHHMVTSVARTPGGAHASRATSGLHRSRCASPRTPAVRRAWNDTARRHRCKLVHRWQALSGSSVQSQLPVSNPHAQVDPQSQRKAVLMGLFDAPTCRRSPVLSAEWQVSRCRGSQWCEFSTCGRQLDSGNRGVLGCRPRWGRKLLRLTLVRKRTSAPSREYVRVRSRSANFPLRSAG